VFKRVTWWIVGATMGAAGSKWAERKVKRKVSQTVARYTPPAVADRVKTNTKQRTLTVVGGVKNAVETGRDAAGEREDELRARYATGPRRTSAKANNGNNQR
jgi:hypothetical protein